MGFSEQLQYYLKYREMNTNEAIKSFEHVDPNYLKCFYEKYKLHRFCDKVEKNTVHNILRWVFEIILFPNGIENTISFKNSMEMINFSQKNSVYLNCFCHAYILRDALVSVGIKSRIVYCLPINCEFYGNHVVVEYYDSQYNKWGVIDPTYNFYFCSPEGIPLSLIELRVSIAQKDYKVVIDNNRFKKISHELVTNIDYFNMMKRVVIVLQYEGVLDSETYRYRLIPEKYNVPTLINPIDKIIYTYNYKFFY